MMEFYFCHNSNAASSIGALTTCESSQLGAYATKAKAAYGSDVATWPTSTITEMGAVVGKRLLAMLSIKRPGHFLT